MFSVLGIVESYIYARSRDKVSIQFNIDFNN